MENKAMQVDKKVTEKTQKKSKSINHKIYDYRVYAESRPHCYALPIF